MNVPAASKKEEKRTKNTQTPFVPRKAETGQILLVMGNKP
jgi:hypothetical protein